MWFHLLWPLCLPLFVTVNVNIYQCVKITMVERLLKIQLLTGRGGVLNLSPWDTVYGF